MTSLLAPVLSRSPKRLGLVWPCKNAPRVNRASGEAVAAKTLRAGAINESANTNGEVITTVSITAESRMASLLGAAVRRYTNEDQLKFAPGDTFFKFAAEMAERLIIFPSAQAQR